MNKPIRIENLLARVFLVWLLITLFVALFAVPHAQGQTEQTATRFTRPTSASGIVKVYLCTNPAANTEFTCTVPAGKIWRVISLRFQFVTSATVANRTVTVAVDDGTNTFYEASAGSAQAASLTRTHLFADSGYTGGTIDSRHNIPSIPNLFVGPGYRLRSVTALMDATDDYGQPAMYVEEWPAQ